MSSANRIGWHLQVLHPHHLVHTEPASLRTTKCRYFCIDEFGVGFRSIMEKGEMVPNMDRLAQVLRPRFVLSYANFQPETLAAREKCAARMTGYLATLRYHQLELTERLIQRPV